MTPSSSLREEARALAGQGMVPERTPGQTSNRVAPPIGAALQPGAGCNSSRASSQVAPSDDQIEAAFASAWAERHGCSIEATLISDTCAMKRKMRRAA